MQNLTYSKSTSLYCRQLIFSCVHNLTSYIYDRPTYGRFLEHERPPFSKIDKSKDSDIDTRADRNYSLKFDERQLKCDCYVWLCNIGYSGLDAQLCNFISKQSNYGDSADASETSPNCGPTNYPRLDTFIHNMRIK